MLEWQRLEGWIHPSQVVLSKSSKLWLGCQPIFVAGRMGKRTPNAQDLRSCTKGAAGEGTPRQTTTRKKKPRPRKRRLLPSYSKRVGDLSSNPMSAAPTTVAKRFGRASNGRHYAVKKSIEKTSEIEKQYQRPYYWKRHEHL